MGGNPGQTCRQPARKAFSGVSGAWKVAGRLEILQAFCGNYRRRCQPILSPEDEVRSRTSLLISSGLVSSGSSPAVFGSACASVKIPSPRWCGRMPRRSAGVIEWVDVGQLDHGPVAVFPGVSCGDGLVVLGVEFPVAGFVPGAGGGHCSGHWRDSFREEWALARETFVSALGQSLSWVVSCSGVICLICSRPQRGWGRVLRSSRRRWGFFKNPWAGRNSEKSISVTAMGFLQKPAAGEKIEKSFLVTAGRFLKNPSGWRKIPKTRFW